jgi:hypothetical protein
VYPREQALGEGDVLVQVIEDLVQLLADAGVLLNPRLELVKQRGVDHGLRHLAVAVCLVVVVWCLCCPMFAEWSFALLTDEFLRRF